MQDVMERFSVFLRSKGAKEHTIKTYTRFVKALLEECPRPTLEDVLRFLARHKDKAPLTQSTCAYALRAFFEANPQLGVDPTLIPLPSRPEILRKITVIPEETIKRIALSEDLKVGAMIALMYELGLRVSEVGKIRCGDLNLSDWTIYVRRSKGSVSSVLPIVTGWVKEVVKRYVEWRGCRDPNKPLFPGKGGKGISYTRVSALIKEVLKKHGLGSARPHDIRHSRATNLLKSGVNVVTVSHVLGHKSLSSTSRYLHLVPEDIRRELERAMRR
jgi:integrase